MTIDNQTLTQLKGLAKIAYTGKVPHKVSTLYSQENNGQVLTKELADEVLRERFSELVPNKKALRKNQIEVFELIEETIDEILPRRMNEIFDRFAEFKQFNDGDKARFLMPKGKTGIRRFIERVALGVPLKRARLDKDFADMSFFALGGAVWIEWEHFLDGTYSFADLCDILVEELMNAVYDELVEALDTAVQGNAFKKIHTQTGGTFSVDGMLDLISYAQAYGAGGATIVGSPSFCSKIQETGSFISDADKTDMRERGYIGKFRGASVVVIPQQYRADGTPMLDEKVGFVFPTGNRPEDKFIKIGFEGETQVRNKDNDDWSMTYEVYKKMGVLVGDTAGIGLYKVQ